VVVVAEIKRWVKTGSTFVENAPAFFVLFLSFFYSKSQLLYQALQGGSAFIAPKTMVRGHGPARDTAAAALAVSSSSVYYIQNALNSCEGSLLGRREEVKRTTGGGRSDRQTTKCLYNRNADKSEEQEMRRLQFRHITFRGRRVARALWLVMVSVDVNFSPLSQQARKKRGFFSKK